MNNEKVTDVVVLCVAFALGDWNYFPFNFPIQHACIQSRAQGHFGFLSVVWLPDNIIWRLYR